MKAPAASAPVLLLCTLAAGCSLDTLPLPAPDMALSEPPLDPKTIFNTKAKPDLDASCQGCHSMKQQTVDAFLVPGKEYDSITAYHMGVFLTPDPDQSLLLRKGQHTGPALTSGQYDDVKSWLSVEAATRGSAMMNSPATPSVAVRGGDFYVSLEKLVGDPLAKITFTVAQQPENTYFISNLQVVAGPLTGIKITHPIFLIFSQSGANPDPADSLAQVDISVPAKQSMSLGSGSVILTRVPVPARLALAFQVIAQVNPMPPGSIQCKDFADFDKNVRPVMQAPCAAVCHSTAGADPRAAQATAAFDMGAAASMVMADRQALCLRALGRVDTSNPA